MRRSIGFRVAAWLLPCVVAALLIDAASSATYYVDPQGDDASFGRSATFPWRTVERVASAELAPGDRVLFKGGATWNEALAPSVSGLRSAPIIFSSYGSGRAALNGGIFLADVRWLRFERLSITGPSQGVLGSGRGTGSRNIALHSLSIADVEIGVNSANTRDRKWLITASRIARTQDSAVIVQGKGFQIKGNTIADAGLGVSIPYAKHGVYLKGRSGRVSRNTIRRVSNAGITTRFPGAILEWNRIIDAKTGISYFQDAAKRGRSILRHNTISNVRDGIFISSSSAESFFVHSNTVTAQRNGLHTKKVRGLWAWDNAIEAPDPQQFEGKRIGRPPVGYVDGSVPRLATLRSFGLTASTANTRPRVRARIGCRSVAARRCRVKVSAMVGKKRVANGKLTIRKGKRGQVVMRIRRSAVRARSSARRPATMRVLWIARDAAGRKTIEHASFRVRL